MSVLSERLLAGTSKPQSRPALLALEDGTAFVGMACGASGEVFGEICFNTSLEGYLEVLTDPSYAGQIVTMTYPQIGNYGVNLGDVQAKHPALRGLVVRDMCFTPSSWRNHMPLPEYLEREGIVALEGIDTRALVRHVREHGAMRAALSTEDLDVSSLVGKAQASDSIVGVNLAKTVSCAEPYVFDAGSVHGAPDDSKPALPRSDKAFAYAAPNPPRFKVIAYDCGAKQSILEELVRAGCEVTVVPWNTPATDVLAQSPDGVFLSNGPGDPDAVSETYQQVKQLLGNVPVFGICLGHQMICKAAGGRMEKLKYGHHGGNQPVMNLRTGRVEITAQNHGFNLDFESLGTPIEPESPSSAHPPRLMNSMFGRVELTHVNLNDGTAEGIAFLDIPAFSVQYHPEANPGPTDSRYLFIAFTRLMEGHAQYLDIDIAQNRLQGWRF